MNKLKVVFFVWILNGDIFLNTFFSFNYCLSDFYLLSLVHPNNWERERNKDNTSNEALEDTIATTTFGPMLTVCLHNLSVAFSEFTFELSMILMINNIMHQRLMVFIL